MVETFDEALERIADERRQAEALKFLKVAVLEQAADKFVSVVAAHVSNISPDVVRLAAGLLLDVALERRFPTTVTR